MIIQVLLAGCAGGAAVSLVVDAAMALDNWINSILGGPGFGRRKVTLGGMVGDTIVGCAIGAFTVGLGELWNLIRAGDIPITDIPIGDEPPTGGGVPLPANGTVMSTSEVLDLADEWLGSGYRDLGGGRYVSADGTRQFRMTDSDVSGAHGGGPHVNLEELVADPTRPGKFIITGNTHIYLGDAP